MDKDYDRKLKIIVVGEGAPGKSSLVDRFLTEQFLDIYDRNIEELYEKLVEVDGERLCLEIVDTSSCSVAPATRELSYEGVDGVIVVYDVTQDCHLNELEETMAEVNHFCVPGLISRTLVGNKIDCQERNKVAIKDAQKFAIDNEFDLHIQASAKTGENVNEVFFETARLLLERARKLKEQEDLVKARFSESTSGLKKLTHRVFNARKRAPRATEKPKVTISNPADFKVPSAEDDEMKLAELFAVIETLKEKHLSVTFRPVKFVFAGTPRVGKSTLKKRLMKEITNLTTHPTLISSTGLEKPQVVRVSLSNELESSNFSISCASTSVASMFAHDWRDQDLQQQIGILFNTMLQCKSDQCLPEEFCDQGGSSIYSDPEDDDKSIISKCSTQQKFHSDPEALQVELEPPTAAPFTLREEIKTVVKTVHWKKTRVLLRALVEKSASVCIMDTGGQPEFHEVLPHVLKGPALYLVFFSLLEAKDGTDCLDRKFTVEYTSEDGLPVVPYKSVYPVKEVLFQLLTGFHSLQQSQQVLQVIPQQKFVQSLCHPQAVLVGTYKDKFLQKRFSQKQRRLDAINEKLLATFKGSAFMEKSFLSTVPAELQCVNVARLGDRCKPCKDDKVYIAVDNMHGTEQELSDFRHFISQRIFEVAKPVELPCSVLLFHLLLRYHYEDNPGFCTLDQCCKLALRCQINLHEVKNILKYLHITLGTVLYYDDIGSLKEIVFCNPNLLLSHINQLIAVCFTSHPATKIMGNTARKTGIIEPELLEYVCSTTDSKRVISNEQIIDFLLHYRLMMKIHTSDGEKLFMPCLLLPNPTVVSVTTMFLKELHTVPFLIQFFSKVIPLGQFTSLVVQLCQKPWSSGKPWEAAIQHRYRNQITFLMDSLLRVRLTARPQFIEVLVEGSETASEDELTMFCRKVWKHVTEAINETRLGNKFDHGFYCPGSFNARQTPHFARALSKKILGCSQGEVCKSRWLCPARYSVWLEEDKSLLLSADMVHGSLPKKCTRGLLPEVDDCVLPCGAANVINCTTTTIEVNDTPNTEEKSSGLLGCDYPKCIQSSIEGFPSLNGSLNINDLETVLNELDQISEFFQFGLHLGLRASMLDRIEEERVKVALRIKDVVKAWLCRDYMVEKYGPPTWESLCKAVKKLNPTLAMNIQKRHCQ